jgi:integrase
MKHEQQKDLAALTDDLLVLSGHDATELSTTYDNNYLKAATAENTRLAYRSDVRHFERWGGLLPATPDAILKYLHAYATSLNPRTLARRITAIKQWHFNQGFADPTQHAAISKTLKGIARIHGKPRQKAHALSVNELLEIVQTLEMDNTLTARRDNALIQIGYFGALRRSEIIKIRVEDLTWVEQGIDVLIPQSKTDQAHEGQFSAVPHGEGSLCAVRALKRWLEVAGIETGYIFRSIKKGDKLQDMPLSGSAVNIILKSRAHNTGLTHINLISSHSLRRGLTTSASQTHASLTSLIRQGRWKQSNTVMEYIDAAERFNDNVATKVIDSVTKEKR